MDKNSLNEVIACLPRGRTKYYYYKDRYALMLLSYYIGDGMKIADLKKSHLAGLLQRPAVKQLLSELHHGVVDLEKLQSQWPVSTDAIQPFVITLGRWGGGSPRWQQTSRFGYNLVLQLNFSYAHDQLYRKLVKPEVGAALNYYGHPVLRTYSRELFRETLAWARLDIDFDTNEVLIEEIQSDWVREARDLLQEALLCKKQGGNDLNWYQVNGAVDHVIHYYNDVLKPYLQIWDEALLAACLDFIKNELGITRVYYHSHDSGAKLKSIEGHTPRDLYTRLPKRFCFRKTDEHPLFLQKERRFRKTIRKIAAPLWYRMDLEEGRSNASIS